MFKTTLIALATLATLALGASPSETAAAEASLAGNVLRNTVSGKTVYLKISGFELPIRYSAGGSMTGSMSMVAAALSRVVIFEKRARRRKRFHTIPGRAQHKS